VSVLDLGGRVFVVTGGNTGIGLGIARGIARAGGNVAIWARREGRNAEAVDELTELGADAASFRCDISDQEQVETALAGTVKRFGRLDGLVANAGVTSRVPFVEMSLEEWKRVLDVNLDGAFLCLRAAARYLVDRAEGGSLVGVSSVVALYGAPGQEHYSASKTALTGVMRGLAVELARFGIRCNTLLPGWTETELTAQARIYEKFVTNTTARTPVRRWGTIHDFETVGAYLCDPTLTFHTGDSLVVDGGYSVF
jgi:NAD(P)-dependent dehydrogenase (short-subunit alcohol dehydrogenase family)